MKSKHSPGVKRKAKRNEATAATNAAPPDYRYAALCLAVCCQAATILISWPAWNLRTAPPNLPLLPVPEVSFGIPLLISLAATLVWPVRGAIAHAVLLTLAIAADQYRLQPQVLSLAVLMFACTCDVGTWLGRWYLAAMWLWAGLHKFLSPEWYGWQAWTFLSECGLPADDWHLPFAIAVATVETALGVIAMISPRRAAIPCLVLHLGLLAMLSPLMRDFNASVWPWNLATALVGAWILRRDMAAPSGWLPGLAIAALLILPAGYFANLVNPHLAFVLYSGNMPHAYHTSQAGVRQLDGWATGLTVPFPDSPRLLVQLFRQTAAAGDKLHVLDPRWRLPDRYFVMQPDGAVQEISRARFLSSSPQSGEVVGIEVADPSLVWSLAQQGVKLKLEAGLVVSAALAGKHADDALVARLAGLPSLQELRIADGAVTGETLAALASLEYLEVLEIDRCPLTGAGARQIASLPAIRWLRLADVPVTAGDLSTLGALTNLEVLQLPQAQLDSQSLAWISGLKDLTWLDLSGTSLGNDDLRYLAHLPALEVLSLAGTNVTDDGLAHLQPLQRLQHLDLQGAKTTAAGAQKLQHELPACRIER